MSSLTTALPFLSELTEVALRHGWKGSEVGGSSVEASGLQTPLRRVLGLLGATYFSMEEVDPTLDIVYGMLELAEALELCQCLPVAPPLDLLI